ncbi:hypothetical protein D5086_006961 [Populus alba]|uniref:Uncharacterized protein n=1 Tax=Populus alba TaxID=43335 RepID=A0ACC4CPB8_POPAL
MLNHRAPDPSVSELSSQKHSMVGFVSAGFNFSGSYPLGFKTVLQFLVFIKLLDELEDPTRLTLLYGCKATFKDVSSLPACVLVPTIPPNQSFIIKVSSEDCTSVSKGHPPVCGTLFSFKYFMGEEEHEKAESKAVSLPTPAKEHGPVQEEKEASLNDAANEKSLVPVSEKAADPTADESVSGGSNNRDAILSRVETEKRCALIKAWVENEKAKVENKAHKKLSAIGSWETTKKVSVEAKIQKFEEKLERKKAEYAEKMKNRAAELHKTAEEKKAMIEAKKSEECLKVEETAAKFRATGVLTQFEISVNYISSFQAFLGSELSFCGLVRGKGRAADGVPYHKKCFKCSHCNGLLVMSSYSSIDGVLYCRPHYDQLFKETGNFIKKLQSCLMCVFPIMQTKAPSKLSAMFSGTQDKCASCTKTVYPLEKVTVEGEFFHKSCFRCSHGGCFITPSSYAALDGILYCKAHFSQLFKQKGSYSYLTKTSTMKKNAVNLPEEKSEAEQNHLTVPEASSHLAIAHENVQN